MAKKEFKSGLDNLLQSTIDTEEAIPKIDKKGKAEKPKEVRATFIIEESQVEMLKAIAFWERIQIKQVLYNAVDLFIKSYSDAEIQNLLTTYNKKNHEK